MNVTIFCIHRTQTKNLIFNPKNPVNPDSKFISRKMFKRIAHSTQTKDLIFNPKNPDSKPFYSIVKVATAPASNAIGK
jgi:hypothetical protein